MMKRKPQPRTAFTHLAELRVQRAMNNIRLLRDMANTTAFEFEQADGDKIVKALQAAVREMAAAFESPITPKKEVEFKL